MTAQVAPQSVLDELERAAVAYELISHPRTTTARAEALVLGLDPREVAKTIVLIAPSGFVRAVLSASERLDLHKVRGILDTNDVELATEAALAGAYPEFELGAVPPVGGGRGDLVLVDRALGERDSIVLEAGTHEQSLRIRTADLLALSDAQVVDLSMD